MKHSYAGMTAYLFEVVLVLLFWGVGGEPKPKTKPQILPVFKVAKQTVLIRSEVYLLLLLLYASILGLVVCIQLNVCVSSCRFSQEASNKVVVTEELKTFHYFC